MKKFDKEIVDNFCSTRSKIWARCREINEYYYNSDLWKKGIHYMCDFYIDTGNNTIEIYEGAHGQDLCFNLDDFFDNERLIKAIEEDIKEYKEEHGML